MIFRRSVVICGCCLGAFFAGPAPANGQGFTSDEWYISWGYNRSAYTVSDVQMWGTGPSGEAFDVTLQDAQANDMPERFQAKVYFHPGLFTIPQFNARFGKRIAPNLWVSAGWDHMKYKLKKQWVVADGYADASDLGLEDEFPCGDASRMERRFFAVGPRLQLGTQRRDEFCPIQLGTPNRPLALRQ